MTTHKFYTQKICGSPYAVSPDEAMLDISHELRTPLTVIQGALDLLESGRLGVLSDKGQRMVKIAASNVERLMRLTTAIEQESESIVGLVSAEELARLRMERDLQLALSQRQFRLQYQPIVSLGNGAVTGFEALMRWHHPTLGTISPTQFIPIAEETGAIIEIGAWVMREACHQLQAWRQQFPEQFNTLTISVNLSCKQIACLDLPQQIAQILEETHLEAHSLKLEITESSIMDNTEVIEVVLSQLQVLGVQLYIDDFGTGYSSLSRLLELPLDVLKIDRSFVQQLCSKRGEYLVRTIANLAQNLGIDVIAEGVETEEQSLKLQSLGCNRGQGYFFAKPLDSGTVPLLICDLPTQF
jgi:c-di-GMP phosphodiesterase